MNKLKLTPQQINKLLERFTQQELAEIFEVSARTIRNQKKENNKPKKKRGREAEISGKLLFNLFYFLIGQGGRKSYTQQKMADYLSKKAEQLNHLQKVSRFKKLFPCLPQTEIIALDECGFHLNETPRYGYAYKSFRANYRKPSYLGNNHTLILCIQNIANKGVIHYELIEGGMKTKNFHNFLTNLKLPTNEKHYLIMDNLKVHHAKQSCIKLGLTTIKELLASKNIEPVYLPPYDPEMNSVEYCFNLIRQQVEKNKPRTYEKLKSIIDKIIELDNLPSLPIPSPPAPLNNKPRKKKPKTVNNPRPIKYQKGRKPPISMACHFPTMAGFGKRSTTSQTFHNLKT
ncbi:3953_t:CDS:2 [Ambispora leptoticha]|uniref:3953_t:CDS:1 n=1 Tax=Ambispora leptoticha TaxID=144679 RepID=A0A9N8YRG6_9GLOM|nr:3953_t:CDS:2 [Ambispora leptoticha]